MKKTNLVKILSVAASVLVLAGCAGNNDNDSVGKMQVDTDATIEEGNALLDVISIGMAESDVKAVLENNKVDYVEDDGVLSGSTMVKFLSYDSSCDYVIGDGKMESAGYSLYFKDEATRDSAEEILTNYLKSKMANDAYQTVLEDASTETYYYPVDTFEVEGEEQIRYISLAKVEYYEAPADGYSEYGYEITDEYIPSVDWEGLASNTIEEE